MADFWRGRRVLVTGGAGFVGSHLVERLLARGAAVAVAALSDPSIDRFLAPVRPRITALVGDLRDPDHARRIVEGQEVVFHLAAVVGGVAYNVRHPASLFRDNLQPFLSVIEAARLAGTSRFVITSSACVYAREASVPTPESEGFVGLPEETNRGYGWAKRMEEYVGEAYGAQFGLNVAIGRPVNIYGPRDNFDPERSHVIAALIRRVLAGEDPLRVWGDGRATRSFLYVEDAARGLLALAEHAPGVEAINLGSEEETSIRALAELIVRLSGRPRAIEFDPGKPSGQPRRRLDTALATARLGFKPEVSLEEGIHRTIEWYRAQ